MSSTLDFDAFAGELDLDEIDSIVSGGREKGLYDEDIVAFAQSGALGKRYDFSGKKAQSVKTGFESAKERATKNEKLDEDTKTAVASIEVYIRRNKGEDGKPDPNGTEYVFLVNQSAVRAAKAARAAQ